MMKKLTFILLLVCFSLIVLSQDCNDIIYPLDDKSTIFDCCIIEINDGNLVSYSKDDSTNTIRARSIIKNGLSIVLKSYKINTEENTIKQNGDFQSSIPPLLYNGHDFEYYNELHKKYKYKSVRGMFYTFSGIGLAGLGTIVTLANNYTVDIFAAALFVGGFFTFNIGLPSWAANAAKAKANIDAMDYINNMNRHGFDISLGSTSNGIGVIVSF